ncbi:uncharacterized protein YbjT (DUF2867 family) [Granulicella aggregans]|uniref:Uncharacterized protein YbjT (DUF2867 family) n=1 Tax=Granulicella aggregans TaxID=474949 RepID=A0A7W7ZHG0_9BACT|nr:NAD(P)H-binding protein [Granulicella aggregans]MBB5059803.1 uncharacterized protein YbjT (DUF2867 family) [Granulicella aggregans]
MQVILFGATGMVGQGVLRECLIDPDVTRVVSVVRSASGQSDAKLEEIVHRDFLDYASIEEQLTGLDACFFTLGVSSAGMSEEAYRKVTYDVTTAAARTLVKMNPAMTFLYVSGAGTDSSEHGGTMWARVKGKTENDLLAMPFMAAYMFRPGMIQPLHGIVSKTKAYRILYTITAPLLPILRALIPKYITTTEEVGRAMIQVAKVGYPKRVIESVEIGGIVARV